MTVLVRVVGQSSDDVWRQLNASQWSRTQWYTRFGSDGITKQGNHGGYRFPNITIPAGSIINSAYLTFRATQTESGTTCSARIAAEKVDNPLTFADSSAAFDTRRGNITAYVSWSIPAWTDSADYNSPEIKTVVQAIIDRGGWASGNAIVIFCGDWTYGSGLDAFRNSSTWDWTTDPKITIDYTEPAELGGKTAHMSAKMIAAKMI